MKFPRRCRGNTSSVPVVDSGPSGKSVEHSLFLHLLQATNDARSPVFVPTGSVNN